MRKIKFISSIALAVALFSGCATTSLQTSAKMTQSIFVDPVKKEKRIIFISSKNTSGKNVEIEQKIKSLLVQKGYKITDDPNLATFVLLTNILYCDKKSENNAVNGAAAGGAIGAGVGSYNRGTATGTVVGGLIGAATLGLVGKLTEDDIYQMQVDISIREKRNQTVSVNEGGRRGQASVSDSGKSGFLNSFAGEIRNDNASGSMNSNATNYQSQNYKRNYTEKRTIIFAEATKMNLNYEEAKPVLENKIASQIAGLF